MEAEDNTIARVTAGKGIRCWADSYRAEYRQWGGGGPILLSLFGHHNAVRATWAALVADRRSYYDSGVKIGDRGVSLTKDIRYVSLRHPIGHQLLHLVLLHSGATAQAPVTNGSFYLVGADAEQAFWPRLCRACAVPMRPEWRHDVWQLGQANGNITLLGGFGMPAYSIDVDTEKWTETITTAVKEGRLK